MAGRNQLGLGFCWLCLRDTEYGVEVVSGVSDTGTDNCICMVGAMMSLACAMRDIHNVVGLTKNGHDLSWRGSEWGVRPWKLNGIGRRADGLGPTPFYHGYKRRPTTRPVGRRLKGVERRPKGVGRIERVSGRHRLS